MKRYKVKHTSILHNGSLYKEGSTIELEDNKAKRLEDFLELLPSQMASSRTQTQKQQSKKTTTDETKKETKTVEVKDETKQAGGEDGTKTL